MQTSLPGQQWLKALSVRQGRAREWLAKALEEQQQSGHFPSPEICRQPQTWRETCELMIKSTAAVNASLRGAKSIIFTGSGSRIRRRLFQTSRLPGQRCPLWRFSGGGSEDARDDRRPRHLSSVRKLSWAPAWTDELHRQQHPGGLFYLFRPNEARLRNGPPSRTLPKSLGLRKLIVGEAIPTEVTGPEDVVVECRGLKQLAIEMRSRWMLL